MAIAGMRARAHMLQRYDKEFKDTANKGSYCDIEFLSVHTHKYIFGSINLQLQA
jgi:hypothetical protein